MGGGGGGGGLCLQNSLSVLWCRFCLLLGLSVSWLVVIFIVYGRPSGSGGSAFCFPYNSVTVRRILFKFGRFRQ